MKLSDRLPALRPFVTCALVAVAFLVIPTFKTGADIGIVHWKNVLQNFSSLGLVTLALGLTMIAGEFDLSVSSMFLLGAMIAVKTGVHSPAQGVLIAVVVGFAVGLVQGLIVAKLRMNSMTVTLGGFIALLGLVFVISDSQSISYANLAIGEHLDSSIAGVFSLRILFTIAIFLVIGAIFFFTTLGRDLRAVGSDRKASRTAGVRVDGLVIGVFTLSGFLATFGGALQGYSLAYATPDRTVGPLIFATTAALLGGVALSGGRGNPIGIAAGILTLAMITEAIPVLHSPEYVNALIPGLVLLVVTLVDAPELKRRLRAYLERSGRSETSRSFVSAEGAIDATVSDKLPERGRE